MCKAAPLPRICFRVDFIANDDSTGEVPWVREIVQKFDGIARSKKAILIPEIGIVSPSLSLKSVKLSWSFWVLGRDNGLLILWSI
jgi:hypothetical protein